MEILLPWKNEKMRLQLDDDISFRLIEPVDSPALKNRQITEGLHTVAYREWKSSNRECLVVVNDGTRPTPTAEIITSDREFFLSRSVSFIVAAGAHRAPAESELKKIFGDMYESVKSRILFHDARDPRKLRYYGTTSRGTEVYFNKALDDFSGILIIGSVEPHYFAGYSGGRKGLMPGIAGYKTIEDNHRLAIDENAEPLRLEGNPVHEDMIEAVSLLEDKSIFSIMTVLNRRHDICLIKSGGMYDTFRETVKAAEGIYSVRIAERADIIVTCARSPMDLNLYQAHKAVENVSSVLSPGGMIILVSFCPEGIGDSGFYDLLKEERTPDRVLKRIKDNYRLGYHKAARLAKLLTNSSLYAVTGLEEGILTEIFIKPFKTVQVALQEALKEFSVKGGKAPKVLIVPDGTVTVPDLKSRDGGSGDKKTV